MTFFINFVVVSRYWDRSMKMLPNKCWKTWTCIWYLARDQHPRRVREQRDVLEVGHGVVERPLVEGLVDGEHGAAGEQHGVAVGRRLGDAGRAGHAAGAGDVLDHHLLAEDVA